MFNERIPYNAEILSKVTRHNVAVVEKALYLFEELGLIEKLSNGAVTNEKTNFSAGFAPTGPIILKEGVHYGNTTPATGVEGQLFFTPVDEA